MCGDFGGFVNSSHQSAQHGAWRKFIHLANAVQLLGCAPRDHIGATRVPTHGLHQLIHQQFPHALRLIHVVRLSSDVAPHRAFQRVNMHIRQGFGHALRGRRHKRAMKRARHGELAGAQTKCAGLGTSAIARIGVAA